MYILSKGKDHMKVGDWKQFGFPLGDPILPVLTLALWTMAVSTAVVADPGIPAVGTSIDMSAQVSGSATLQH